jgi:hypothetical protein
MTIAIHTKDLWLVIEWDEKLDSEVAPFRPLVFHRRRAPA